MNLRELAKICDVSPMTVSLVINEPETTRVSADTRERVLRAVRDHAYKPRTRIHRAPEIRTVGIAAPVGASLFTADDYVGRAVQGILAHPAAQCLNLMLFANQLFNSPNVHPAIRAYCDGKCDGLVIIAPHRGSALGPALAERGIPLVIVGADDTADFSAASQPTIIDVDNVEIGRLAVRHLAGLGHRKIGFVGGPDFVVSACQRLAGFEQEMHQQGRAFSRSWLFPFDHQEQVQAQSVARQWSQEPGNRPTAYFCWNDRTAIALASCLKLQGVSILSVDDNLAAANHTPPLTTFRQPWELIGEMTLNELQKQWNACARTEPARILLPVQLIQRQSCAGLIRENHL